MTSLLLFYCNLFRFVLFALYVWFFKNLFIIDFLNFQYAIYFHFFCEISERLNKIQLWNKKSRYKLRFKVCKSLSTGGGIMIYTWAELQNYLQDVFATNLFQYIRFVCSR